MPSAMSPDADSRAGLGEASGGVRWDAWSILALALAVRLFVLSRVTDLAVVADEAYYWGYGLGSADSLVLRPPLWGAVVASSRWLFAEPIGARAVTAVIGGCTAPLLYLLGRDVLGRRTGLVAGMLFAVYPEHVGFSHYLWAETLLTFLIVLGNYLFFRFFREERTGLLVLGAVTLGAALLVKVLAAVAFGALAVTMWTRALEGKVRKTALAAGVFLLPAVIYSSFASLTVNRFVPVGETGLYSLRQQIGLDKRGQPFGDPALRAEKKAELARALRERSLGRAVRDATTQFYLLWAPNSFVSVRLLTHQKQLEGWRYDLDQGRAKSLAAIVTCAYLFVVVFGLCGLCLSAPSAFKLNAVLHLLGVCALCALAAMNSRYRLPFFFLFVVHAAHVLAHPRLVFGRLLEWKRLLPLLALLALFVHVVLTQRGGIGAWG